MDIDFFQKLFQSIFYVIGAIVAVLTYVKAKNGLLNTVNTEYHKKVIERLAALGDELYKEFDAESDDFWANDESVKEVLNRIHERVLPNKERIISDQLEIPGIPISKRESKIYNLANKYKSDPFLPPQIRDKVVDLFEARANAMTSAFHDALEEYKSGLTAGRYWDTLDSNHGWVHNKINRRLYEMGCGVSQVEESVHEIRIEMQKYFERFNPIGK